METNAKKKKFFTSVANNCKFKDEANVRDVYYAIVRTIVQECKKNGKILLPGLGDMELKERDRRRIRNVNTGEVHETKPHKVFKFTACKMLKEYINHK